MTLADCTVMVVEDHEFQRRTMLQILANLGAGALLEAADGESALALLDREGADIVVCDLDMPGMDGVEFFRHLAERSVDTAIVVVSGLEEAVLRAAETTARAYGVEVLGVVRKPLTARRLLEVVGLHRPSAAPGRPPANGAQTEAWRSALVTSAVRVVLAARTDLLSGRPAGIEARARRWSPDGDVDAAVDLSVGTTGDVAGPLVDLLVDAACAALAELAPVAGELDATIVVPPAACTDLGLADRLSAGVRAAGIAPQRLCVMLPARPALPSSPVVLDVLTRLRLRGFGLGIEGQAGEVHAALAARSGLPLTEVALVADEVRGAAASRQGSEALEATVRALRSSGLRVVATGCDTEADRDLLTAAGCDRAQGAAIGGAASIAELASWAAGAA